MIENYIQLVPFIHASMFGKGFVGVYDREKIIECKQGTKIILPFKNGDILPEGTASMDSLRNSESVSEEIGSEVCGIPYYSIAYPIKQDGAIIGGMVIAIPSEMIYASQKLQDMAHELVASMEQISAAIENITGSAQLLAENGDSVAVSSQDIQNKAEEMEEVVKYIDSVASDTKLLGLNAAIEAARAGEIGKGFGVVASEIRSMAVSSANAAKDIRKSIKGIRNNIKDVTGEMIHLGGNTQEISSAMQEITASIESLTQTSEELELIAGSL